MKPLLIAGLLFGFSIGAISCGSDSTETAAKDTATSRAPSIKEESVTYQLDTLNMQGFVAYDENKEGKRPAVIVVHEWWGLTDYAKSRARQLAELGYIAFAADMYGNGKTVSDPQNAMAMVSPFYQNPGLTKTRLDAALKQLKTYGQTDTSNIAAIGYCYGGFVVLNAAKLGADIKGVVSFHGGLGGVSPNKNLLKAKVLVCNGAGDKLVSAEEQAAFKKGMDSIGAVYTFKDYPGALHAFTNPAATETGKKFGIPIAYNAAADSASWNDMKNFFAGIFPGNK